MTARQRGRRRRDERANGSPAATGAIGFAMRRSTGSSTGDARIRRQRFFHGDSRTAIDTGRQRNRRGGAAIRCGGRAGTSGRIGRTGSVATSVATVALLFGWPAPSPR
jgi:hypothetical protein